jgi:NADP-dependent 3-hydroxy acid dehydrogenase YdfG
MSESRADNTPANLAEDDKLRTLFGDFVRDLQTTFPEYQSDFDALYCSDSSDSGKRVLNIERCLSHSQKVFPERFFDILYKNGDIFDVQESNDVNTEFLPNIEFKKLWNLEGVTDGTKETIWKYLQLIVFSVIGKVEDKSGFGSSEKLFEAIDSNEFKAKLESTIDELEKLFDFSNNTMDDNSEHNTSNGSQEQDKQSNGQNFEMPNPDDIHNHISGLLEGKLGKLATEIAEETAQELNLDVSNMESSSEMFEKMFKDPTKLMSIVKKVGSKLDSKMKSGEIDEKELMGEAQDLMKQMKNMPGMGKMGDIMKNLGPLASQLGGAGGAGMFGKNARFNKSAFNSHMKREETRSRAMATLEKRREEKKRKEQEEAQRLAEQAAKPVSQADIEALLNEDWVNEPSVSQQPRRHNIKKQGAKNKKNKNKK